jgi:hypothetical protein
VRESSKKQKANQSVEDLPRANPHAACYQVLYVLFIGRSRKGLLFSKATLLPGIKGVRYRISMILLRQLQNDAYSDSCLSAPPTKPHCGFFNSITVTNPNLSFADAKDRAEYMSKLSQKAICNNSLAAFLNVFSFHKGPHVFAAQKIDGESPQGAE